MSITPSIASVRRQQRKLDRLNAAVERALGRMRIEGCVLQLTHNGLRGPTSTVGSNNGTGEHIDDAVARAVITRTHVVPVGDTLLEGTLSQTWRYCD
jgi:hypothetical protein